VGGTVTGLAATGLVLQLNGTADLPVSADGSFAFPGTLASGTNYAVTVATQPTGPFQTCVVSGGSGVIAGSNISVAVTCTTDRYSVGGTVTGLAGSGLVLQLNGLEDLPVTSDGSFVFPTSLLRGTEYNVTIRSQPSTFREVCSTSSSSGTGATAPITSVRINCGVVGGFVYAVRDTIDFSDLIYAYGFKPDTGALLPLGPVGFTNTYVRGSAISADRRTWYTSGADDGSSTVFMYTVDLDKGTLSDRWATVVTGHVAGQIALTPSGEFLYSIDVANGSLYAFSIDAATGRPTGQRDVAAAPAAAYRLGVDLAMSPDGAYLYRLVEVSDTQPVDACNCTPTVLTTFAIDNSTGDLTELTTISLANMNGLTMDPLGRFLYVRDVGESYPRNNTTIYPYSINPATGELTAASEIVTVVNEGNDLIVEPHGRFAYLAGGYTFLPGDERIDAFSIDASTGALTTMGMTTGVEGSIATDSAGRFLFGSVSMFPSGVPWQVASTLQITQSGPAAGELSAPQSGPGLASVFTVVIE
jgi:6-phosphogluconolactonase (cycloisomerase 2 family)